jgi:hypothetical protein
MTYYVSKVFWLLAAPTSALPSKLLYQRPIGSICPVRYWLLSLGPVRQGREGMERPHRLPANG